ncbi:MAG: DNA-formamidopyrimidine glycosylase [endosymbiont of Galathealinum brachiosum]|uniref:Formamidopyrimidine-DNA glycosylase n=1 Tax=endosymbiont of Galathealinum brachiosum TaxID=2200906 RepID=A0A370DFM5_9GAMM|nr:MAG: DNA-formamidopyrimidine glycosylase [endosymbiont of Galathealinum brachiosum]
MPELPEVETSRRGIKPHILNKKVTDVIIRQKNLRWPIPSSIKKQLSGQKIQTVERRGKYILLTTEAGTVILHLGMSGSLRILNKSTPPDKHDHFDIIFSNNKVLRLRDPRRFGAVLWTKKDPLKHKLLSKLGPEPLEDEFTAQYLFESSRNRKVAIKTFLMNSHIVVGVGNIYANESLFTAGINPKRLAHKISLQRYVKLVSAVKNILKRSIEQGGTTLRDFTQQDGSPGYFQQTLLVYGLTNKPCPNCGKAIKQITQAQRSTFYCTNCQK